MKLFEVKVKNEHEMPPVVLHFACDYISEIENILYEHGNSAFTVVEAKCISENIYVKGINKEYN